MRVVEKFYSVQEIALLLSMSPKWVIGKLNEKAFGTGVKNLGSDRAPDYRVPASGINAFLETCAVFSEPGIAARSTGELRRKVQEETI
jgi:hypothetical protein